jgi:hypothetical protein
MIRPLLSFVLILVVAGCVELRDPDAVPPSAQLEPRQ